MRIVLKSHNLIFLHSNVNITYFYVIFKFSEDSACIGRVYVQDADDWDSGDKSYAWLQEAHPYFSLNENNGELNISSRIMEGRYSF